MNFGTLLDTLIALVVVILLLSLVVQTIQTAGKKLLKIKSRQIEDSLLDLFENTLGQPSAPRGGPWALFDASPVVQTVFSAVAKAVRFLPRLFNKDLRQSLPAVAAPGTAGRLRAETLARFGQLGRFAQSGRPMLDSLAKDDLLRVLAQLEPKFLLGADAEAAFFSDLQAATDAVAALAGEIEAVAGDAALRGEAGAKFGAFRSAITPLIVDCRAMVSGEPPTLKSGLLARDLFALRQVRPREALDLLADVQRKVAADRAAAAQGPAADALLSLSQKLDGITRGLGALQTHFDAFTTPLRSRLAEAERWFDTVMQGFDERYTRSMKTWGLVIAFGVVVGLNANFFHLYDAVAHHAATRDRIIAAHDAVQAGAAPVPDQNDRDRVAQETALYADLGFRPLSRAQVVRWWHDVGVAEGWFVRTLGVLVGWALTTLLLSAGAPFWEDVLESLFGLKNLLRKGSETQNIEQRSGAGQPKS